MADSARDPAAAVVSTSVLAAGEGFKQVAPAILCKARNPLLRTGPERKKCQAQFLTWNRAVKSPWTMFLI